MLNRQMCSRLLIPIKHPVTLFAALTMVAIGLMIPQCGLAQVPDMSGAWQVSLSVNNGSGGSASADLASTPQTSSCNGGSNCVQVTLQFSDGSTITATGNLNGGSLSNGSFTQSDSTGLWTTGSADGTVDSTVVSLNFSGMRSDGTSQNGSTYSQNYDPPPPPDPCGGGNIVCLL